MTGSDHNATSRRKTDVLLNDFVRHLPFSFHDVFSLIRIGLFLSVPVVFLIALKILWTATLRNCCIGGLLLIKCNQNSALLSLFNSFLKLGRVVRLSLPFLSRGCSGVSSELFEPLQF